MFRILLLMFDCFNLKNKSGCKQFTVAAEIEKIEWFTFTGVLGNEVVGIWEKYTNKTDVNASDAHFSEKCIVTGDGI